MSKKMSHMDLYLQHLNELMTTHHQAHELAVKQGKKRRAKYIEGVLKGLHLSLESFKIYALGYELPSIEEEESQDKRPAVFLKN